jgi:hypothetical protein
MQLLFAYSLWLRVLMLAKLGAQKVNDFEGSARDQNQKHVQYGLVWKNTLRNTSDPKSSPESIPPKVYIKAHHIVLQTCCRA